MAVRKTPGSLWLSATLTACFNHSGINFFLNCVIEKLCLYNVYCLRFRQIEMFSGLKNRIFVFQRTIELLLERIAQLERFNSALVSENEELKEKVKTLHTILENQKSNAYLSQ